MFYILNQLLHLRYRTKLCLCSIYIYAHVIREHSQPKFGPNNMTNQLNHGMAEKTGKLCSWYDI